LTIVSFRGAGRCCTHRVGTAASRDVDRLAARLDGDRERGAGDGDERRDAALVEALAA
jgi:hypothetical protein